MTFIMFTAGCSPTELINLAIIQKEKKKALGFDLHPNCLKWQALLLYTSFKEWVGSRKGNKLTENLPPTYTREEEKYNSEGFLL